MPTGAMKLCLEGLKARQMIAQGKRSETSAALGHQSKMDQALEGRLLSAVKQVGAKRDGPWRKSRLAARILIRKEAGRMRPREQALARRLSKDPEVTNRLIQQALLAAREHKEHKGEKWCLCVLLWLSSVVAAQAAVDSSVFIRVHPWLPQEFL